MFANPYTLQNCAALVALVTQWEEAFPLYEWDEDVLAVTRDFSIQLQDPKMGDFASNALTIIESCLEEYCDISSFCRSSSIDSIKGIQCGEFSQDVCSTVVAPLNADIGGIGVRRTKFLNGKHQRTE